MSQKDGGPAFPSPQFAVPDTLREEQIMLLRSLSGMSMRQYYKAKAMEGILSNPNYNGEIEGAVRDASDYADRMLAEDIEHVTRQED